MAFVTDNLVKAGRDVRRFLKGSDLYNGSATFDVLSYPRQAPTGARVSFNGTRIRYKFRFFRGAFRHRRNLISVMGRALSGAIAHVCLLRDRGLCTSICIF